MASPAAEVSLHCVICFEEFDTRERPPVVLPCGHTYVCLVCSKRLTKCMECREPLFWTPPVPKGPSPALHMNGRSPIPGNRYGARGRYHSAPHTPPHPAQSHPPAKEEPVQLPIPKNTVLLGMIEAAERQKRLLLGDTESKPHNLADELVDEEDEPLVDPILAGMSAFAGSCGTYAVKEPFGLAVLPFDPNMQHHDHDEDHLKPDEEKKEDKVKEPFTIEMGQTVQVVNVDEGVYQLARGAGYVVANVNQLVKVGDPVEKSCRLEGMLKSVKKKQEELQNELDQINALVAGLQEDIKLQLEEPENHPVISAPPDREFLKVNDENDETAMMKMPATPPRINKVDYGPHVAIRLSHSTDSTAVELGEDSGDSRVDPQTPATYHTPAQHHQDEVMLHSPANSCPMPLNASHHSELEHPYIDCHTHGLPRYRVNTDDDLHGLTWAGFGCGSSLFGERLIEQDANPGGIMTLSFDDILVDSGLGDRNERDRSHSVSGDATTYSTDTAPSLQSGSFDGGTVNFRTGMSGHTGLSQVRQKKTSPMSRYRQIPLLMSAHRGIPAAARGAAAGLQPRKPPQDHI